MRWYATVSGDRGQDLSSVLGSNVVPILSPIPMHARLPRLGVRHVYLMDLDRLDEHQKQKLVEHLSMRFGLSSDEVECDLEAKGMPLLAEDCLISGDVRALV